MQIRNSSPTFNEPSLFAGNKFIDLQVVTVQLAWPTRTSKPSVTLNYSGAPLERTRQYGKPTYKA